MAAEDEGRRLRRVQSSLANPALFGELYVRPHDPQWKEPLPAFAREMLAFAMDCRRGTVILPPEFLKPVSVDALVLMGDGSRRPLGEIEVGDLVIGHSGTARRVRAVKDHGELDCLRVTTWHGRELIATPDHPVLTPEGWRPLGELRIGTTLASVGSQGDLARFRDAVTAIEEIGPREVRCLMVNGDHSFTANDLVVHNTTLLSQVLPLWLTARAVAFGEMLRGLLLSEEEGMAMGNLGFVKWHIDNNEALANDFIDKDGRPLLRKDPTENVWREDAIVVARQGVSKDPTWQAKGLDSKGIQGRRLDWLIGDDVITPKNAFSPAMRKSALNLWELQLTTRLVESGKAIIAGNFNDHRDLLSTLSSRPSYKTFRRPALHEPGKPHRAASLEDEDAELTWPENWTRARLEQEAEDKPQRFRRIFLLDARAESGERLRADWVTLISEGEIPFGEARFFMSVDPAPGGTTNDDHDFFTVTVGAAHGPYLDVCESIAVRSAIPGQTRLVAALHDRYNRVGEGIIAIGGAKVAMDRYFRGALTVAAPQLEGKLAEVSIPGAKNERLEGLGSYAQSRYLRIVANVWTAQTSDIADRYQELSLAEEWTSFPHGRHDDRLDGIDVLIRTAREYASGNVREIELEAT